MNFLRELTRLFLVLLFCATGWLSVYAFLVDEPLSLKEQGLVLLSFAVLFYLTKYIWKGFRQGRK